MLDFIDEQRPIYGVESICAVLPIAPSTYDARKARQADPDRRAARQRRDEQLQIAIRRVWEDSFRLYGGCRVWRQLRRDGWDVARCTVTRLMR